MDDLQVLSSLLSHQVEIYTQLLRLENEKTFILLEGKAQELDKYLIEEQPLIMQSTNLEHERLALQKKMGIEAFTLKQIINEFAANNEFDLTKHYDELAGLLKKIETANNLNTRLINSRLKTRQILLWGNDANHNQITPNFCLTHNTRPKLFQ